MMYIDSKLHIAASELIPMVMTRKNYDYHRANGNFNTVGYGGNGRTVYVNYESMTLSLKEKVADYYECPYKYAAREPLLSQLELDVAAEEFYRNYLLPNGDKLPSSDFDVNGKKQINYVYRYKESAEYLNMIIKLTADKKTLKSELNLTMGGFWEAVIGLIKVRQVSLPTTYKRLTSKLKGYQQNGYEFLIETHRFGNKNSIKVKTEIAQALLHKLLSLANRHNNEVVAEEYNKWAKENNLEAITPEAVKYWRKKWNITTMLEIEGKGELYNKVAKKIKRNRASGVLLYINSDDNNFDVYFSGEYTTQVLDEKTGRKKNIVVKTKWYRPAIYVIIDTFNDYILGYAVGHTITDELVKEAYRNAQHHVMELTGDKYSWQQIQTDRWHVSGKGTTNLEKFLMSTGAFTPASLVNKQGKYIERSFGTEWHNELKKLFPYSYAGNNITAKTKYSKERLNPKDFPAISNVDKAVHAFVTAMRLTKRKGKTLTRRDEWLESFKTCVKSKKVLLSTEKYLGVYGYKTEKPLTISNNGIEFRLNNQLFEYEMSQEQILQHIGKKGFVHYDTHNMNEVLFTDYKNTRFVVGDYQKVSAAKADYKEGESKRIQSLLDEKKQVMPFVQSHLTKRDLLLDRAGIDVESRLQAGVLEKGLHFEDEKTMKAIQNGAKIKSSHQEDNDDDYDVLNQILNG